MARLKGFRSLLKMTICHVSGWHRYAILSGESQKKGWQSVAAPLASPTICNCPFHMFGLSMLPNVVKETALTMALSNGRKTRRLNELAKHRNQICKTRHESKFASFKLVQPAPRSFCHAVDGIMWHLWRLRDTTLQSFRCSRTWPAAWLGSPLLSLKRSTNWWKATSENCTRPLQSMSFAKFFLSLVSMLIKVWPRAAIAALGTWHARSRSSCSSCSELTIGHPTTATVRLGVFRLESGHEGWQFDGFAILTYSSSCTDVSELICVPAVGRYDVCIWSINLEIQPMEAWANKLKRACDFHKNMEQTCLRKMVSKNFRVAGIHHHHHHHDIPPHHIASHQITPHLITSLHITPQLISTLTPRILLVICRNHCGRLLASTLAKDWSWWWLTILKYETLSPWSSASVGFEIGWKIIPSGLSDAGKNFSWRMKM